MAKPKSAATRKSPPKKTEVGESGEGEAPVGSLAALAFERLLPEIDSVPPGETVRITVDVSKAVSMVLGAQAGILAHRNELVVLPGFKVDYLTQLDQYAMAAWYAHLVAMPGEAKEGQARWSARTKEMLDEGGALRARLLGDADALARRGLVEEKVVATIRSGHGHVDLANDLVALGMMFTERWATLEHNTAATKAEVNRAAQLGPELLWALGVRTHGAPVAPSVAAERRMRAYALLARAYDEVRRGLTYLRWREGDVDEIAPSLYSVRADRARPSSDEPEDGEVAADGAVANEGVAGTERP